jgi:hypothetical protein
MRKKMRKMSLATILIMAGFLVAALFCGCLPASDNDDSGAISCAEDDVCQPECDNDPDCAASADDDDDTAASDEACTEGEHSCGVYPDETLFLCNDGELEEIMDCGDCDYIGPGTGIHDDTSCKPEPEDAPPDSWNDDYIYHGPGCYFGFNIICYPP